ncbi:uncharacterized protein LOC129571876 [Sitodiplosis mosellana]|uniref:uncharacterized protein LOC129571876 n=1 Tax=Sitodiplosis mosellana TaxID=263140 RepID=UPI0024442CC1|nr:uncharacterized protein LOC129571876 [Sitodiplosis mosellana]
MGKCYFNKEWIPQYKSWLAESKLGRENAYCKLCKRDFSIVNKGIADVKQHMGTNVHQMYENAASKTVAINRLFQTTSDKKTAAAEATFVYHLIKEGHSFRSATCTSQLIREVFGKNPDFRCSETKAEAIATGVLAPMAIDMLLKEIRDVNFLTFCLDSSSKGNFKVLPVLVRYFSHETGTHTKLIDAFQLDDETGETLFTKLKFVWEKYDLRAKLKAISGDNAKENFGGLTRGGDKNMFSRLQKEFNNELVGIGCAAHLVHKAIEKACDQFQPFFDIEATVVNIYNYFKTSCTRNARLQHLINADEYMKLLGYANTRFIGFHGCIDRIIKNFDALKTFFDTEKETPVALGRFFDHHLSKLLLVFVRDQCEYFEAVIRSLEGSHVSGYEAARTIFSFCTSIRERMDENFTSLQFQQELTTIIDSLPFTDTILKKANKRSIHEEVFVDVEYIDEIVRKFQNISVTYLETWGVHLKPLVDTYSWIELREMPLWSTLESPVKNTADMLLAKKLIKQEEYNTVFNEFVNVKTYLKSVPVVDRKTIFEIWNEKHASIEDRWLEVFSNLKKKSASYKVFSKLVEYALMMPGANCDCERIFSHMKHYWNDKKSRLSFGTLKSYLIIKNNLSFDCIQFHEFIASQPDYLQKISSHGKYESAKESHSNKAHAAA